MIAESIPTLDCANAGVLKSYSPAKTPWAAIVAMYSLQAGMAMPVALYLVTLTIMLFRPPDVGFYSLDRIALGILLFFVLLRGLALRQCLRVGGWLTFPMAGLIALASLNAFTHPYQTSTWSVMAAKFAVPFTMFWLAGMTFRTDESLRWLERFCLLVLAYLIFTAIASLAGIRELVFPPYILDESIGIHADRARGPFLQAVANGVALNMLGLLAINQYLHKQSRAILAGGLFLLSLAIVATKTRGVWLSFAVSVIWLLLRNRKMRLRSVWGGLALASVAGFLLASNVGEERIRIEDRLEDRNSVDFRMAAYHEGWEMFLARPLTGWGTAELQATLADRIQGFRGQSFAIHNSYLEILLEHGICGIGFYAWLIIALFRLGGKNRKDTRGVASLRKMWPLLLGVYLGNAMFVVMNYPFVNGLLFTFAGILSAGNDRRRWNDSGARISI